MSQAIGQLPGTGSLLAPRREDALRQYVAAGLTPGRLVQILREFDDGWLDRGIERIGAGKFIMGSDAFLNPMSVGIGPVVFAPISDEHKRMILGLTQARLLDKVGALPAEIKERHKPYFDSL